MRADFERHSAGGSTGNLLGESTTKRSEMLKKFARTEGRGQKTVQGKVKDSAAAPNKKQ